MSTIDQPGQHRRSRKTWGLLVILGLGGVLGAWAALSHGAKKQAPPDPGRARWAEVEHVYSGDRVKLGSGEKVILAGIRCPYGHEPMHDQATQRAKELLEGHKVRLRFDEAERTREDDLQAYVSVDTNLINEVLVREGLAYVRLTPHTRRMADILLAAQAEARVQHRGLWRSPAPGRAASFPADPKYGNFHLPACAETPKIKADRLVTFDSRDAALNAGFAPCSKCRP